MTDLLDEIQEDLKEERYSRIVRKLSKIFFILAAAILIFTSVYVWKERASNELQQSLSIIFNKAIVSAENDQLDEAISYFDQVIEHSHQQYAALAYLQKAAILIKQNKHEQAQVTLLKMIEHKHFDLAFRELAQVVFLGNQLKINNIEDPQNSEMLSRLTKSNKPWQLSALQLKALYDLKQNKIEDAKVALKEITASGQASKYSQDTATNILSVISKIK